ncbi:MAG: hypothetical protein U0527_10725 [Candidatus Eisenbacteria bacterium]
MDLEKVTPSPLELLHEDAAEKLVELFPAYSLDEIRTERDRMISLPSSSSCCGSGSPGARP